MFQFSIAKLIDIEHILAIQMCQRIARMCRNCLLGHYLTHQLLISFSF